MTARTHDAVHGYVTLKQGRASLYIQQLRDRLTKLETPGHGSANFNEETCRARGAYLETRGHRRPGGWWRGGGHEVLQPSLQVFLFCTCVGCSEALAFFFFREGQLFSPSLSSSSYYLLLYLVVSIPAVLVWVVHFFSTYFLRLGFSGACTGAKREVSFFWAGYSVDFSLEASANVWNCHVECWGWGSPLLMYHLTNREG